jgi:hypothetical protein
MYIRWDHSKRAGLQPLGMSAGRRMAGFLGGLAGTGLRRGLPMWAEFLRRNLDPVCDEYVRGDNSSFKI